MSAAAKYGRLPRGSEGKGGRGQSRKKSWKSNDSTSLLFNALWPRKKMQFGRVNIPKKIIEWRGVGNIGSAVIGSHVFTLGLASGTEGTSRNKDWRGGMARRKAGE